MFKVEEEQDLKIEELTYLDIISQKKSMYGCHNNWIILQDSDPNLKTILYKDKIIINRYCHQFPKETAE